MLQWFVVSGRETGGLSSAYRLRGQLRVRVCRVAARSFLIPAELAPDMKPGWHQRAEFIVAVGAQRPCGGAERRRLLASAGFGFGPWARFGRLLARRRGPKLGFAGRSQPRALALRSRGLPGPCAPFPGAGFTGLSLFARVPHGHRHGWVVRTASALAGPLGQGTSRRSRPSGPQRWGRLGQSCVCAWLAQWSRAVSSRASRREQAAWEAYAEGPERRVQTALIWGNSQALGWRAFGNDERGVCKTACRAEVNGGVAAGSSGGLAR